MEHHIRVRRKQHFKKYYISNLILVETLSPGQPQKIEKIPNCSGKWLQQFNENYQYHIWLNLFQIQITQQIQGARNGQHLAHWLCMNLNKFRTWEDEDGGVSRFYQSMYQQFNNIRMSIIDTLYIHKSGILYAISDHGFLYGWDLSSYIIHCMLKQQTTPLVSESLRIQINSGGNKSIHLYHQSIYICSQQSVLRITLSELETYRKRYTERKGGNIENANFHRISIKQSIGSICFVAETDEDLQIHHYLIMGSVNGNLFKYGIEGEGHLQLICEVYPQQQIVEIIPFKDNLLLAATSLGKLAIINLYVNGVVESIKVPECLPIRKLFYFSNFNRFYTVHQNHILEWSIKLNQCIGYFAYSHANCINTFENGEVWIGGCERTIKVVNSHNQTQDIETNMGMITTLKKMSGTCLECIGGDYGLIQVYNGKQPAMLLFVSEL